MPTQLITPYEVVMYSPAGKDYPTDWICKLIPAVEDEYGYECLGETLYKWLMDNVVAPPSDAVEWECGRSYETGEYIIRNGCLFYSISDMNATDPASDESEGWEVAKRFGTNTCANDFWQLHLRNILALKVFVRSVGVTTRKAGPNGLTVLEGGGSFGNQGFKTGSKNELADYKNDILAEIETATRNMIRWANRTVRDDQNCEVPLSTMLLCQTNNCQPTTRSVRRWGFRY